MIGRARAVWRGSSRDGNGPLDVEIAAGWDACMASVVRPDLQARVKALLEQGLPKPGDAKAHLGAYLGRLGR
jgi:hypothetical protein